MARVAAGAALAGGMGALPQAFAQQGASCRPSSITPTVMDKQTAYKDATSYNNY
jgi:sulfoxide reductase catalytic subunit YedY